MQKVPNTTMSMEGQSMNAAQLPPIQMATPMKKTAPVRPRTVAKSRPCRGGSNLTGATARPVKAALFLSGMSVMLANPCSPLASSTLGLDDFRHRHAKPILDHDDLAPRDQTVVDVDIDRLADLAVQFHDGTSP